MIINTSAGQAKNALFWNTIKFDDKQYFYTDGQYVGVEIPDVELSTGRVNGLVIYMSDEVSTDVLPEGTIYHIVWTTSSYKTLSSDVCGRYNYTSSAGVGNGAPIYKSIAQKPIYDEVAQKVVVYLPIYSHDNFLTNGRYYDVMIW